MKEVNNQVMLEEDPLTEKEVPEAAATEASIRPSDQEVGAQELSTEACKDPEPHLST